MKSTLRSNYNGVCKKRCLTISPKILLTLAILTGWTTFDILILLYAEVAELADAHDSNSCSVRSVGSIPTFGTSPGLCEGRGLLDPHLFYNHLKSTIRSAIYAEN